MYNAGPTVAFDLLYIFIAISPTRHKRPKATRSPLGVCVCVRVCVGGARESERESNK